MGRAEVRVVAAAYFESQGLPFVGKVFTARPLVVDENDFDVAMANTVEVSPGNQSSAVLIVNIPESQRERRTLTGRGAVDDSDIHTVVIEVFFASASADGMLAQADHDKLIDAIVVAIRSDPLLGQPNTIWSAGEFQAGVRVQQHEPFTNDDGNMIFIVATVRFETWEWVSGTGV